MPGCAWGKRNSSWNVNPIQVPPDALIFGFCLFRLIIVLGSGCGSSPKSNRFILVTHPTYPQNFIRICPQLFEISCTQTDRGENITSFTLCGGGKYNRTLLPKRGFSIGLREWFRGSLIQAMKNGVGIAQARWAEWPPPMPYFLAK